MSDRHRRHVYGRVTPFAGVWIEIMLLTEGWDCPAVTPFAGVWIEICLSFLGKPSTWVTPFAGVWIEIDGIFYPTHVPIGHPLRGGVD